MSTNQAITTLLLSTALLPLGCQDPPEAAAPARVSTTETPKPVVVPVELDAEELAEIAKLDEADQALTKLQKTCLISRKGHLGAMGVPIKVTFENKVGFLCCEGCKAAFDKDPAAAFAKAGL